MALGVIHQISLRRFVSSLFALVFLAAVLAITGSGLALPISGNVVIQPVLVNPVGGPAVTPNAAQDLAYAQAIYSQIGLNVPFNAPLTLTLNSPNVAAPGSWSSAAFAANLNAGINLNAKANAAFAAANGGANLPATVVPVYYVTSIPGADGNTLSQEDVGAGNLPGIEVANGPKTDTFAHELGHMLLNTWRWRNGSTPDNGIHASNNNDLMAPGKSRNIPVSLNPLTPPGSQPAPSGTLDIIGVDAGGQNPTFGYINNNPGMAPTNVQYAMPEVNAMYGASDAGGTPVNTLVIGQKAVNISLTVGTNTLVGTPWGKTNTIQWTDSSGPTGVSLIVNETARIQSTTTATTPEADQFAFEYRDPTGYADGGGNLNLGESGLANLNLSAPYQSIVPNSLQLWEGNYTFTAGATPPDSLTNLVQFAANTYTASASVSSMGQISWQATVSNAALSGNTDLFVEFSAYVPEPASAGLLALAGFALLGSRRRTCRPAKAR